jgi:hypothetical protein
MRFVFGISILAEIGDFHHGDVEKLFSNYFRKLEPGLKMSEYPDKAQTSSDISLSN